MKGKFNHGRKLFRLITHSTLTMHSNWNTLHSFKNFTFSESDEPLEDVVNDNRFNARPCSLCSDIFTLCTQRSFKYNCVVSTPQSLLFSSYTLLLNLVKSFGEVIDVWKNFFSLQLRRSSYFCITELFTEHPVFSSKNCRQQLGAVL